ncbi:hypothetical protein [Tomitella fengzijianii]|uniref:DUF1109 domain-containing protein n=1 Tax=Tomitella fengzijianii TaxID=2597660 RepID=A0A516X455_9ACTN|nr:hypothetical protein [Tomitella fengzijianii]QDQ97840.1 hypothetical protein FO059_11580 [Tomitella fengzijianii]
MAGTAVALILLFLAMGQWWPRDSAWMLTAAAGWALLAVAALCWAISAVYTIGYRRSWSWWQCTWPVVAVLGTAVALVVVPPEFADARPEFDAAAMRVLNSGEPPGRGGLRIGRFEVGGVYVRSGDAYFVDARNTMFTLEQGWVYSADGPPGLPAGDYERLGGHWYRYQRSLDM